MAAPRFAPRLDRSGSGAANGPLWRVPDLPRALNARVRASNHPPEEDRGPRTPERPSRAARQGRSATIPTCRRRRERFFNGAVTGDFGELHGWDKAHSEYNKGVQDLWDKKNYDPSTMTKQQAEDFVKEIKKSKDPRIDNFKRTIINKCIKFGMRRGGWWGRSPD